MTVLEICTLKMASKFSHSLPEVIDGALLLTYCIHIERPWISSEDEYLKLFVDYMQSAKVKIQAAERKSGSRLPEKEIDHYFFHFCQLADSFNFRKVTAALADSIQSGAWKNISKADLVASEEFVKNVLCQFLDYHKIARQKRKPILIAASDILLAAKKYAGRADLYISPEIPIEKLANASDCCGICETDQALALIDCTFFGSAKDAVLIGSRGVYHHQSGDCGFLPYSDLIEESVVRVAAGVIEIGKDHRISTSGTSFPDDAFLALVEDLRRLALSREQITGANAVSKGLASVRGMEALVDMLLVDVVGPLTQKEEYKRYGLSIPNGILLYGPPGCGKTFIARVLADHLGHNFNEIVPSTLASPYIHDTVKRIGEAFADAARHAPTLMFVDEFNAAVPSRELLGSSDNYKAEEVNEWLTQIGGAADRGILFVAATNFPWKIDPAARRTGRLDKKVYVGPPSGLGLKDQLEVHLKGRPTETALDLDELQRQLDGHGFSSSDLRYLVDEAARLAMRTKENIMNKHFDSVLGKQVKPSLNLNLLADYEAFV